MGLMSVIAIWQLAYTFCGIKHGDIRAGWRLSSSMKMECAQTVKTCLEKARTADALDACLK